MGRPRLDINPEQVAGLASIGCTEDEIAMVMGCSRMTLNRRFATDIRRGRSNMHTKLRKKQIEMALAGNVSLLMWLGKQYLGQAEKQEVTGSDGGPLTLTLMDMDGETKKRLKELSGE